MKLTRNGIKDTAAWKAAGIRLPEYDVEAVAAKTRENPVWVHFGAGNIFRIFIGGLADKLIAKGEMDRGITCVETFDFDVVDKIYTPYDNLVLAVTLKADATTEKEVYGSLTEAAVMKFQRANGLSPDGVAGTKTLAKIAAARSGSSSGSSSSSSSSSSGSSSTLRYGVKSDAVRTLQEDLKTLGFYTGSVTGNFGNLTKEAVYNFQKANNLSADGVAGAKTLSKIATAMAGDTSGSSSGSSSSSGSGSSSSSSSSMTLNTSVTLMNGSSSDEVLKLQKMLTKLGYYSGNQTGNFGDKTEEAVVAFQKAMGLTADGIAGKNTLAAINAKYNGSSSSSGSSSSGSGSSGVSANNVRYENFYNWRTKYANGQYCTVYDPATGYSWTLRIMTKDAHMDAEPLTAEDTAIMNKAFGGVTTWTPKPVWVTFSDGKTYLGSTHNVPHSPSHLSNNNFDGHLCVHFPISMEKAKEIGPYATSHQETINEAWDKILAQYR